MTKTIEQLRAEAATPEFMKMFNDAITEGMRQPRMSQCEANLRSDYIRYCLGEIAWRDEFSQFTPR